MLVEDACCCFNYLPLEPEKLTESSYQCKRARTARKPILEKHKGVRAKHFIQEPRKENSQNMFLKIF